MNNSSNYKAGLVLPLTLLLLGVIAIVRTVVAAIDFSSYSWKCRANSIIGINKRWHKHNPDY